MQTLIRFLAGVFTRFVKQFVPDSYIFCLVLTIVAMLGAVFIASKGVLEVVDMWGAGFWGILTFSMQSSLALIAGYALSTAPLFKRGLAYIARLPNNHGQAIVLASLGSLGLWYFHWGVGCVATGILCVEITRQAAKKGIKLHYPLLVAASYMGTVVWHNGISGASQLLVATKGHFLEKSIGVIPVSDTIFAPGNLMIAAYLFLVVPIVAYWMVPPEKECIPPTERVLKEDISAGLRSEVNAGKPGTIAYLLNSTPALSVLFALMGAVFLGFWFGKWNGAFDINIFIIIMTLVGILLHYNPMNYVRTLRSGVEAAIPIMLQFQFYGGIMGILVASGLATIIANWFVSMSTPLTYPIWTYISAGIINMFIPSGGGQFTVQGPIMVEAASKLGVSYSRVITGIANGDAWTNLIQPFWALPLLGFAGLGLRDIMGYCAVVLIFAFVGTAAILAFGAFPM